MNRKDLVNNVMSLSPKAEQRTGQFLFNYLPDPAANVIRGTLFDPFFKDYNKQELTEWIESHLVFGRIPGGQESVIAVFNDDELIWEAQFKFEQLGTGAVTKVQALEWNTSINEAGEKDS